MSCGTVSREKLFEVFSNNLKLFLKKNNLTLFQETTEGKRIITEDIYICPLCLNGFQRITLDQSHSNPLTIEHVPPESSGGKPLILLCKKCNSNKGYESDHIIPKVLESESFSNKIAGNLKKGKINLFPGSNLPFELEIQSNNKLIFNINDLKNEFIQNKLKSILSDSQKHEVKFTIQTPNKYKYAEALLLIGYLLAFNYFGYAFLLESNLENIRNHINTPEDSPLPHTSIVTGTNFSYFKEGIHLVTAPSEFASYVAMFKTKTKKVEKQNMVFLPGPGQIGWDCYLNIKKLNSSINLSLLELTPAFNHNALTMVNGYHNFFDNLIPFA
ncbi:MAG: HNH endonuclease [Lentimicrobium sp.]